MQGYVYKLLVQKKFYVNIICSLCYNCKFVTLVEVTWRFRLLILDKEAHAMYAHALFKGGVINTSYICHKYSFKVNLLLLIPHCLNKIHLMRGEYNHIYSNHLERGCW